MTLNEMLADARKQQELTGQSEAAVSFVLPGKWGRNDRKRLFGKGGPYGQCLCEYEDAVLCVFKANEVVECCEKYIKALEQQP